MAMLETQPLPPDSSAPYPRYFTLEEAAAMLPGIRQGLRKAHRELYALKDDIVLAKRLQLHRKLSGRLQTAQESQKVLRHKWDTYEACLAKWIERFFEKGLILQDLEKGLVDFPYKSQTGEVWMLCWHLGEDGIFYFHSPDDGFRGRQPISFLPD